MIHAKIKEDLKKSMLAKEQEKTLVLRGVISAFMNEMIAKKMTETEIPDEEGFNVLRRLVKQRKDSIDQFTKGNRPDLAKAEESEIKIIEIYLPQMMSKEEVTKIVQAKISEAGTVDKTKIGQFMGGVMKELKGKADGNLVKDVIEGLLK
jgi:uncharacterized protein YqeY